MSCVMCESYGVQLRPAVDVLVVPYSVRLAMDFGLLKTIYLHLLVCYLNKPLLQFVARFVIFII